jgi:mycoredoxin
MSRILDGVWARIASGIPQGRSRSEGNAGSAAPRPITSAQGNQIVLYATAWCGDCRRAKRIFAALGVPYQEIDIDGDAAAREFVQQVNGGMRRVPTILFPDGTRLVEPATSVLEAKLANLPQQLS